MMDVKPGDVVVTRSRMGKDRTEEIVTRVARKYFYVTDRWGNECGYSLKDGQGKGEWSGYARTLAQEEARRRRREALKTLEEHGVVLEYRSSVRLTTEHLEALAEIALSFPTDERG